MNRTIKKIILAISVLPVLFLFQNFGPLGTNLVNLKDDEITKKIDFSKIDQSIREAVEKKASDFYIEAQKKYDEKCKSGKTYTLLGIKINCDMSLEEFFRGKKQYLVKGSIAKLPDDISSSEGVNLSLGDKINYNVTLEPIYKDFYYNSLDHKSGVYNVKKKALHKNLIVKYVPTGNSFITQYCYYLPGVKVSTEISKINLDAEKIIRVIFFNVRLAAKLSVKANLGHYSYNSANTCGLFKVVTDDSKNLSFDDPSVLFQNPEFHISEPKISALKGTGLGLGELNVSGNNLLTRIILYLFGSIKDRVLDSIKDEINKSLASNLTNKINITNETIANGDVWRDLIKELGLQSHVNFTANLNKVVSDVVLNDIKNELQINKADLKKLCEELALKEENPLLAKNISSNCDKYIKKVIIKPFFVDQEQKIMECYKYFHNIDYDYKLKSTVDDSSSIGKNTWWKKECKIMSQIKIIPKK